MMTRLRRLMRFLRLALDQLRQHRHAAQQAEAIAHDRPRLLAISSDHHDRAAFAGTQMRTPVPEAGEKDRDDSEDERLAGASPANKPSFVRRLRWWRAASSVLLVDRELLQARAAVRTTQRGTRASYPKCRP